MTKYKIAGQDEQGKETVLTLSLRIDDDDYVNVIATDDRTGESDSVLRLSPDRQVYVYQCNDKPFDFTIDPDCV